MAKMFYSLDEAAQRLGLSESGVRDLVSKGRLQEFRDRDKIMLKVEQVELLASDGDHDDSGIPLASDSPEGSSMGLKLDDSGPSSSAGSGPGITIEESPKERSGISIFDTDQLEEADPSAVTQITSAGPAGELTMESVGSGSGLLDLTREGDDTSLGADLLEGVYSGDSARDRDVADTAGASGLFETTGAASDVSPGLAAAAVPMAVLAEPLNPTWSGIAGGMAMGILLVTAAAMVLVLLAMLDAARDVISLFSENFWMYVGILGVAVLFCTIIGWAIGRRG